MLFTNKYIKTEKRKFRFGTLHQIRIGEKEKNIISLTSAEELELHQGINLNVSITSTLRGNPRITNRINPKDDTLYMLLSSQGGNTLNGEGKIFILKNQKKYFNILAKGTGGNSNLSTWQCALLRVPKNAIICVKYSGNPKLWQMDIYIIKNNLIYHCYPETFKSACKSLNLENYLILDTNDWISV